VNPLSVAVVGAGIGGLTTALALGRAGHRVTVVERRTGFAEAGAGLQLSPNASRQLIAWGLGAALRRVAGEPERVVIRATRSGRTIGGIALGPLMRERFGAPYWVVHRADLQTILLDAVRALPNVRLGLGRSVDNLSQGERGAVLALATAGGARETLEADCIVGADGLWSSVRSALGDTRKPAFRGFVAWRTTIPRAQAPTGLNGNETGLWLGPRHHVVHYPVSGGRDLNIVAIERRRDPVEGWSAPGAPDDLLARFGSTASLLRDLLARPTSWMQWSLFDLPVRGMADGRVALLGDAAHPVLPFLAQGAALAIEDAAALVAALNANGGDVPSALWSYERERLPRARTVQRHARLNGWAYHRGGLLAFGRSLVFRKLGPEGLTERYGWLYRAGQPETR
jgi:salicylate hydroxylase